MTNGGLEVSQAKRLRALEEENAKLKRLPLTVTRAVGDERYITFGGEEEHPEPGEVIFCDVEGWAHARRWTYRQSGRSAVRSSTRCALLVTEALHDQAAADVARVADTLTAALRAAGAEVERVATAD